MCCCCCLLFFESGKVCFPFIVVFVAYSAVLGQGGTGKRGSLLVQVMCSIQLPNNRNRSLGVNVTSVLHVQTGIWQIMQHSRHNSNSNK